MVLDIENFYILVTEYLHCTDCGKTYMSWGLPILKQLTIGQQLQFPVILTYQNACDVKVIRLLRQRGLGNSTTQVQKKLSEQHSEAWLQRVAHYLTEAKAFMDAHGSGLIDQVNFEEPPPMRPVLTPAWLLHIYGRDVMTRVDEVKATITSVFGEVLKVDSTKKVNDPVLKIQLECSWRLGIQHQATAHCTCLFVSFMAYDAC
jgi:hypothetical protein